MFNVMTITEECSLQEAIDNGHKFVWIGDNRYTIGREHHNDTLGACRVLRGRPDLIYKLSQVVTVKTTIG